MRRYWVEPEAIQGDEVSIEGDVFHHVFDVCRQDEGSRFEVLIGDGSAYMVEVTKVGKKSAQAHIVGKRALAERARPFIHLYLSIPRFHVMDAVLEKAVELGVSSVHPFFSDFSFVRGREKLSDNRQERWQKIVRGATQQTGRGDLMAVSEPTDLRDLLKAFNRQGPAKGLFLYEGDATLEIRSWAEGAASTDSIEEIWAFIGSEGGFSPREVEQFQAVGLSPVTLGQQVLRVETACVAVVSVLKYQWDLFK